MKLSIKTLLLAILLAAAPLLMNAQTPPHPNNGNAPDSGNGPVGGGAPVGSGTVILFALALVYAVKKASHLKIKTAEEPA